MVTVRIYIEGGGEGKELDEVFRRAWKRFFEAAGVRRKPRVIRGGGRQHTFVAFRNRVARDTVEETSLLLVDSEGAVRSDVWEHLRIRDGWVRPAGTNDRQAFLMVQVMETWFLADVDTLQRFFGASFRRSALREWPQLEQVPKQTALHALAQELGVSRRTTNELLRERRAVSPQMALRLARLFGNSAAFWLNVQRAVDLWDAAQTVGNEVESIRPLVTAERR